MMSAELLSVNGFNSSPSELTQTTNRPFDFLDQDSEDDYIPTHKLKLKSPQLSVKSADNRFIDVNSLWICRGTKIIAESQIGSSSKNKAQTKFAKVFIAKIIGQTKPSETEDDNSAFSVYVKKRRYLFHILLGDDLLFLSLTSNTLQQQPFENVFNLLHAIKSTFLFEDSESFGDALGDLHHSYQSQLRMTKSVSCRYLSSSDSEQNDHSKEYDPDCEASEFDDSAFTQDFNHDAFRSPSPTFSFSKPFHHNADINTAHMFQTSLNNLPSPTAFGGSKHSYLQSPTNSMLVSMTNCSSISSNNHLQQYRLNNLAYSEDTECDETINEEKEKELQLNDDFEFSSIVIKKGWMTKLGETFKTWKYRYFELWSNGLLNYFENEMKLKKKGSINIIDEVIEIDLYSNEANADGKEYGFTLTTHSRKWCFVLNKHSMRDDWFLLIQTMVFSEIEMNDKLKKINLRLKRLQTRWKTISENMENDKCNLYQLQYDLKEALKVCAECKKDLSYFCGSDVFTTYSAKIESISENVYGAKLTVDEIVHCRNETPFAERRKMSNLKIRQKQRALCKSLGVENNRIMLKGMIKTRLPSKKLIRAKNALSKKTRCLEVNVYQKYFCVDVEKENAAPLLWKFDELTDILEVCEMKKSDDLLFQITILHSSDRRVQFLFDNEKDAFLWYSTLSSLYNHVVAFDKHQIL